LEEFTLNVQDVESKSPSSGDRLKEIFAKQRLLMEEYEKIEEKNGLLQTKDIPVDLHDKYGQARIKDFAWRVTEELAEAIEAHEIHPELLDHVQEEVIDALHFLTEFTILSGIDSDTLAQRLLSPRAIPESCNNLDNLGKIFAVASLTLGFEENMEYQTMADTVTALGCMCNTLKNKPWKNSHMLTDINLYQKHLVNTWFHFFRLSIAFNLNADRMDDLYFRKNYVNQFRQGSNY